MPLPRTRNVAPGCVPAGTLTVSLFVEQPGNDDLAAERQGREVHRNLAVQVVAVALEELVVLHLDDDVQVARRAAGRSALALAGEPEPLTGRDACRDLHRELPLLVDAARRRRRSRTASR